MEEEDLKYLKMLDILADHGLELQKEIKECMDYLDILHVPSNRIDVKGDSGEGEREKLTLSQRIKLLNYEENK